MIRALILLLTLWSLPAFGEEETTSIPDVPEMRVSISPDHAIAHGGYVQGQIVMRVQIASKYAYESLDLDIPEIDGADIITLLKPRTRQVNSYAGAGYVFETALAIFPRNSGVLTIPPVKVEGSVEPKPDAPQNFSHQTDPVEIRISGIDPSYEDPWWMVASRVEVSETWSKPPEDIRLGEVIRRSVTITAWGVDADRMPQPEHGRTRGVAFSDAGQTAKTEFTPEGLIGTVTRSWDLRIDEGAFAYIAPVGVSYWDPEARIRRKAAVAGRRLEPLPEDREALATALMAQAMDRHDQHRTILGTVLLILCAPVLIFAGLVAWAALPTISDLRLWLNCRSGAKPHDVYAAVQRWRAALPAGENRTGSRNRTGELVDQMNAELFSTSDVSVPRKHLCRGLIGQSALQRVKAVLSRVTKGLDLLLGRTNRL